VARLVAVKGPKDRHPPLGGPAQAEQSEAWVDGSPQTERGTRDTLRMVTC